MQHEWIQKKRRNNDGVLWFDHTYRKVFTKKALVVSVWVVNLGISLFAKCEIVNVTSLSHTLIVKGCFFYW